MLKNGYLLDFCLYDIMVVWGSQLLFVYTTLEFSSMSSLYASKTWLIKFHHFYLEIVLEFLSAQKVQIFDNHQKVPTHTYLTTL